MNRSELIDHLAGVTQQSKKDVDAVLCALIETIQDTVAKGEDVTLIGFGSFSSTQAAARVGRNPQTGEPLKIAASTRPKFSAGAKFKAAVAAKTKKTTSKSTPKKSVKK